ncbi:unnamed protein product [Hydatigera taeniaeformis]|uniref:Mitochondrial import inner membrane translocase subunit TIM50 n=1 Tax=Hydatigena taeniaeformis TaxID=6205 RepID=A0A0R3X6Q9_HYDTA|nr:unnamed protein product [Hydatigera taeniaeformis]
MLLPISRLSMSALAQVFSRKLYFSVVSTSNALHFISLRLLSANTSDFHPSLHRAEEDAGSKSKNDSGSWSGKNAWKLGALSIAASAAFAAGCGIAVWGPPGRDENDVESIRDPISEKLLPDPVEPPYYQPPYTIVLEINDVLVHPDWKTGMPVLSQIDSKGQYIHYRLFRESTRYRKGKHIKDLSCLNRDLSRVILIDWNPDAASMQPRNAFIINRWTGDDSDRELIDLVAFLRMIAMSGVKDVRPVLDHYRQFDDPLAAFKEKHEQLMEAQARKKEQERMAAKKRSFGFSSFSGFRR